MSDGASSVSRWQAAERLFRSDDRWVGGDDAYSIPLDGDRRLWLFGDTFVARSPSGDRRDAVFINNSIAIQRGADPATATMDFYWGDGGSEPDAFFAGSDGGVYRWPGHGALIGDTLILFFMLIRDHPDPPDGIETLTFFEAVGWEALTVDVATADPRDWRRREVSLPEVPFADLVGNGGVVVDGGFLHAHAWRAGRTFLARWPVAQAADADLRDPQWWCGSRAGWSRVGTAEPRSTLNGVGTEFTVHRDPDTGGFVHIQMSGLDPARLERRTAPAVRGPWGEPEVVYQPEPVREAFSYAGKAHPGLATDGLAATYNTIPFTLAAIRERPELYIPRVVRIPEAGLGGTGGETLG